MKALSFRPELVSKAEGEYPHIEKFLRLFDELLLSIEISSHNGATLSIQNLYFPNHPVFDYLAGDTRNRVMFEVGRDNRRDKLISLQEHY